MISTATALTQRVGQARLRSPQAPRDERASAATDDGRHEPRGDAIGQLLDRRAAALRLADHADDLRQQRVGADPLGAHDEAAGAVDRAAGDRRPAPSPPDRLAGDHRLVDRRAALDDDAVDRHLLAGPDAQQVADRDVRQRHVLVAAVADAPRRLRRQAEQLPDRGAGLAARAQLEHLAEQHQHGDDDGRVEVRSRPRRACGSRPGTDPGTTVAAAE